MPAEYNIDKSIKLIVTTWSGVASDSELIDALSKYHQEIRSQADYHTYNEILDLSRVSSFMLSTDGIKNLAQLAVNADVENVKTKLAIIVSTPLAYGLGRMYVTYRSLVPGGGKEVRVYKMYRDALAWMEGSAGS
jgi:hypothetical protein